MSVGMNVALALMLAGVLWPVVDPRVAGWWLGLMALAQGGCLALWWWHRSTDGFEAAWFSAWLTGFRVGAVMTGGLWGAAAWLLFPADEVLYQVFLAFVLAGLTAGAVTSLAPDRVSVTGFVGLTLVPLISGFLTQGTDLALPMGSMILLYLVFIAASAARLRSVLDENLVLARAARRQEAALGQQLAMRRVVNEGAARLLGATPETIDGAIEQMLSQAGEFLGADRAYLVQRCCDGTHMCNTHEWCAPGVASQKNVRQDIPLAAVPWWSAQVDEARAVSVPDVATPPPEAGTERPMFEGLGLVALCGAPVLSGQQVLGFIGVDQLDAARGWGVDAVEFLNLLASILGIALARSVGERAAVTKTHLLQATLEATSNGVLAVDGGRNVLFMNDQFRRIWDIPDDLVLGSGTQDELLLAWAQGQLFDGQGFVQRVDFLYRSEEPAEDLIELRNGRAFERSSRPLLRDGELDGRVWSFHDISERLRAERLALAARERLTMAQQFAKSGIWEWDIASGELQGSWPSLGHSGGETTDDFLTMVHPDDRQTVVDGLTACVERGGGYEVEFRVADSDGTDHWHVGRGNLVRNAEGEPVRILGVTQDIDDLKRTQLALIERERQLLEAQRLARLGRWEADLVTSRVDWAREVYCIFGVEPERFTPTVEAFYAAVHPHDLELVRETAERARKTGRYDVTHRIVRPDGCVRHVHELARIETDAAGNPVRLIGTVQDVTDRRVAEEALLEQNRFQSLVADIAASFVSVTVERLSGTIDVALQSLGEFFDVDRCDVLLLSEDGSTIAAVHDWCREGIESKTSIPQDYSVIDAPWYRKQIVQERSVVHIPHLDELPPEAVDEKALLERIGVKSALSVPVHTAERVYGCLGFDTIRHEKRWPEDQVRSLTVVAQVIANAFERLRAEQAVRTATSRLALATQNVRLGMWEYDLRADHLVFNDEMYALTGLDPDAFTARYAAWDVLLHPDDRRRSAQGVERLREHAIKGWPHSPAEGRTPHATFRIVRADSGEVRWVRGVGSTVVDNRGVPSHMVGTVLDITELVRARESAEQASRAKSDFLTSMSHEFRTPLNAILGFSQLMQYDEALAAGQQENVREILKASHHLLTLINEVLDLARVEAGAIELSLEPVAVYEVVEECLGLIAPLARDRDIRLAHQGNPRAVVRADRTRLRQVLLNLMSNAVKYNRQGGMVRVQMEPSSGESLRISVRDTGVGLAPERLDDLFVAFNRLGAENTGIEGTGIGLALAKHLVEAMGGVIGVQSRVGVGSTFWIELPREADRAEEESSPSEEVVVPAALVDGASRHTVLYIEDNPANIKLVTQIFRRWPKLALLAAPTPGLGLELALAHRPDLILLDINLPGMNGYDVLAVLKAEPALEGTPVVALTANAMPRDVERGKAAGFVEYLTKPLDVEQFLAMVRRCLVGDTT